MRETKRAVVAHAFLAIGLSLSALLLGACGPQAALPPMVDVEVTLIPADGCRATVYPPEVGWAAMFRSTQAEHDKVPTYKIPLRPGTLLDVSVDKKAKGAEAERAVHFLYIYEEQSSPLTFTLTDYGAALNGRPVFLNLDWKGAADFLSSHGDVDLKTVRAVSLGRISDVGVAALKRLKGSRVFVMMPREFPFSEFQKYAQVLKEVRPIGLMVDPGAKLEPILQNAADMEFLAAYGPELPSLKSLLHLRFLQFRFDGDKASDDLAPLRDANQLEVLLVQPQDRGLKNVGDLLELKKLWSLQLQTIASSDDLVAIGKMRRIESLMIEVGKDADLSRLGSLSKLQYLTLMAKEDVQVNLMPLSGFKSLKTLVVPKDYLAKHKQDVNALKAKRPNLEVIGFCMGSGWLVLLLPLAVAAGLVWRRVRGRPAVVRVPLKNN